MAYTTIDKPSNHFNTVLYTGTGSATSITGVGFQPDWIWLKNRSTNNSHQLYDAVRGTTKYLESDNNGAEYTSANGISAFGSDGFTIAGNLTGANNSSDTFVAWNWKAGGSASSNSDGSITSSVSANTTAGFSIVKYTGAGTGTATNVGHGLGVVPDMYMVKSLDSIGNWQTYHHQMSGDPKTDYIQLDTDEAVADYTFWGDTAPTNSVFTVKDGNDVNESGEEYIAYCFKSIKGYSRFGSYIGNGNTNGTFIYTGFKPALIIIKNTTSGSHNWLMFDNKRDIDNPVSQLLMPNQNSAEQTMGTSNPLFDFCSNGFKLRGTGTDGNESGSTHIYMAFAESPFVTSTGIPNNAR
tara:strand:+ start:1453 stop:2511 length:1059 start_codon:yes stop_codon:yes gene_type:complete